MDIFFACPDHLHRAIDLLSDTHRLFDAVHLKAPAESAADEMAVNDDLVERQAGDLGGDLLSPREHLVADPDLAAIRPHMHCAVHRFHRCMCQKWNVVGRFDPVATTKHFRGVADRFCDHSLTFARRFKPTQYVRARNVRVRPLVPYYVECGEPLLRCPHVRSDNRHQIVEHDDLADALDLTCHRLIDAGNLAAENRAGNQRRDPDVWRPGVYSVDGLAIDLVGCVEPLDGATDQLEIVGFLQWWVLRERPAGRGIDECRVIDPSVARIVDHLTFRRAASGRLDAPRPCRRLDEHGAGARTRDAEGHPEAADRSRTSRHLEAKDRIRV